MTDAHTSPETAPRAADISAILQGEHGNPFAVLGMHSAESGGLVVNVFAPDADEVAVTDALKGAPWHGWSGSTRRVLPCQPAAAAQALRLPAVHAERARRGMAGA